MESIGIRELRQNASDVVDRVQSTGVTIEITNHGRPVARIVPLSGSTGASYADLVTSGALRPGRGDVLDLTPVSGAPGAPTTDELLAQDRSDE